MAIRISKEATVVNFDESAASSLIPSQAGGGIDDVVSGLSATSTSTTDNPAQANHEHNPAAATGQSGAPDSRAQSQDHHPPAPEDHHKQQQLFVSTNANKAGRAKSSLTLQLGGITSSTASTSPTAAHFKAVNGGGGLTPSSSPKRAAAVPSPRTPSFKPRANTTTPPFSQQSFQHRQSPTKPPAFSVTPGSPKASAGDYFAALSSSSHQYYHQQEQQHQYTQDIHNRHQVQFDNSPSSSAEDPFHFDERQLALSATGQPSLVKRAGQAIASIFMVVSPRLPFYSIRDDESFLGGGATSDASSNNNNNNTAFTSQHLSPQLSRQHSANGSSIAFSGPTGLFAPHSPSSATRGLFSPSIQQQTSGFGSTGLAPPGTPSLGSRGGHNAKRSFYKDKDELYPSSGASYDSGFRKGNLASTSITSKAAFWRIPWQFARLLSRRSKVLPALILCCVIFFWALGSTRTSSLYDAAQEASARQVGRFFQAADARVGHLNPMKWAMLQSGEGGAAQRTFKGSNGILPNVEIFDVESLDPAGPLAQPGSVGSAHKRYASWEGGRKDGRVVLEEGKEHPIPKLMARAIQRWHALKTRQSKTFAEAVREYERRYGRMPPAGFDRWYAFARYHDVQLIDEFNIIEEDFRMFRAFSGPALRARVGKLANETEFAWNIKVRDGVATSDGELGQHDRAKGVLHLIKKFTKHLPDFHIVYNGHDTARMNVGWEERMRLDELVQRGEYDEIDPEDLEMKPKVPSVEPGWGMRTICPTDSAARAEGFDYGFADKSFTGHEMPELPAGAAGTVVDSFLGYMDVCNSPQYRHFHSSSSYVFPWHPGPTMPLFTAGVHSHFADIHCIITEQFGLESRHDPTWEEKPFDRLVWRGQTSGPLFDKGTAWQSSHRARLHILSHQEDGSRKIAVSDENDIIKEVEIPNYQLNPLFLDTGFVGPPVQCVEEDGTCDEMKKVFNGFDPRISFERASLFKYVLDVDGNSWSGRFPRLMASNAAVVKATIYREFWTDWCIPWLHFIPIQVDYSDLWDVMAFFRGGLNEEGAHDDAAKSIAVAGKNWARDHFRYEDMEAYTFRQYLEYARLWADDREAMTYSGEVEGYEPVWLADEADEI